MLEASPSDIAMCLNDVEIAVDFSMGSEGGMQIERGLRRPLTENLLERKMVQEQLQVLYTAQGPERAKERRFYSTSLDCWWFD